MPFAQVNGIDLYYEVHGDGPVLVFAHGGLGNHLSWWQQVAEFSRRFRCVSFDHRGFGLSRETEGGPGPAVFADDLRALLDHLEIERAALVGQSMGGWTVLGFASAYPHRTRALVLCDTMAGVEGPGLQAPNRPPRRESGMAAISATALARDFAAREPAMNFLYHQISALNVQLDSGTLRRLLTVKNRVEPIVERNVPTLIFAGDADEMTPPPVMEALARQIPHARLVKVSGAGHSVYWEKPGEFNSILSEFLDSVK